MPCLLGRAFSLGCRAVEEQHEPVSRIVLRIGRFEGRTRDNAHGAQLRVLDDLGRDFGGEHQVARAVRERVGAAPPTGEGNDVAGRELSFAPERAQGRSSRYNHDEFFYPVLDVERHPIGTGLEGPSELLRAGVAGYGLTAQSTGLLRVCTELGADSKISVGSWLARASLDLHETPMHPFLRKVDFAAEVQALVWFEVV